MDTSSWFDGNRDRESRRNFCIFIFLLYPTMRTTRLFVNGCCRKWRRKALAGYCRWPKAALWENRSQGGVKFPTGGKARERFRQRKVSRSGEIPGPTV
jgi:hypothetical protein